MTALLTKLRMLVERYNQNENQIEIRVNEPMSLHTTFRIGGPASLYLIPRSVRALTDVCAMIRETGVRYYVVGNGSNLLFDDSGFEGAILSTAALSGIRIDETLVTAESGAQLIHICKRARDSGLAGLEFAYGIPGSVGGAVYMNAGAYGGEMAHVLQKSVYLDLTDLTIHTIPLSEHAYGYRDSVYRHNDFLLLSAVLSLSRGNAEDISAKMNDYMNRRITKQPLDYPSAGSVFKRFPGRYTGQMIEEAGLKGYTIGGAQVSEKHAGFIINRGGATARDVLALVEHIQKTIFDRFGCALECEMIYVK
ncbi:MAG: UDP-N-acetylmuramate dehydrogenase [Eubacteriales bacterium]